MAALLLSTVTLFASFSCVTIFRGGGGISPKYLRSTLNLFSNFSTITPSVAALLLSTVTLFASFSCVTIFRGATAIKPKFGDFISGLVGAAGLVGFLASAYFVENLTKLHTKDEWMKFFFILASLFAISWIFYLPIKFDASKNNRILSLGH